MFYSRRAGIYLSLTVVTAAVLVGAFLGLTLFEGEPPEGELNGLPEFVTGPVNLGAVVMDGKRGLGLLTVVALQGSTKRTVIERKYQFKGFMNSEGARSDDVELVVDPATLGLSQGRFVLELRVWDYWLCSGGRGNMDVSRRQATVDTIAPYIKAVSRLHYVSQGSTGFVVYQCAPDTIESGVMIGHDLFPGFALSGETDNTLHCCFFPIAHDADPDLKATLWARDAAGNHGRSQFHLQIKKKVFKSERITLSEGFMDRTHPYFGVDVTPPVYRRLMNS